MCEAFLHEKIPFNVLTLVHYHDGVVINSHDIEYSKAWCSARGVAQHFVNVNIVEEVFNREPDYPTPQVFRYFQIKVLQEVEALGGYGVLGGGEQLYELDANGPHLVLHNGYSVAYEWCKDNGTAHEPYFFFSTPELVQAWIDIPLVEFTLRKGDVYAHRANANDLKILVIRSMFPKQARRPKYDGFENVERLERSANLKLRTYLGNRIQYIKKYANDIRHELLFLEM